MSNKNTESENKIEQENSKTSSEQKKNEKLENLRQYVLDEIGEKNTSKNNQDDTESPKKLEIKKEKEKKSSPPKEEEKTNHSSNISNVKKIKRRPEIKVKKKNEDRKFKSLKKEVHKKNKFNPKKWLTRFFITLIVLIIAFSLIVISGIYFFKWDNIYTNKVIDYLPLPIAKINNDFISYKEFRDLYMAYLVSAGNMNNSSNLNVIESDIKKDALDRLIDKKIIENISNNRNIFITDAEVKVYYDMYIGEAGSKENLEKIVLEMYGWNLDKFEKMILRPFILQDKLNNYFIWSKDFNKTGEEKANDIFNQLKKDYTKEKFIELVKSSSEDIATINNEGDLGWVEKDKMVKEFEDAVFNLEENQISEVIRTIYGFHIIMVDEINKEEEKVKARHILIKARHLGDAITAEKNNTKILNFLK
jgi:hypothetical protein